MEGDLLLALAAYAPDTDSLVTLADKLWDNYVPIWARPRFKDESDPIRIFLFAYLLADLFALPSLEGRDTTPSALSNLTLTDLLKDISHRSFVQGFTHHVKRLHGGAVPDIKDVPTRFHPWVEEFGKSLTYSERARKVAVHNLLSWLPTFACFYGKEPCELNIRDIMEHHIRGYFDFLQRKVRTGQMAPNTAHTQSVTILQFVRWSRKRYGIMIPNGVRCLPQVRPSPSDEYWLPNYNHARSFFTSLLQYSPNPERDFALYGLFYVNGLRPGEAVDLKWDDVNIDRALLTIQEKGGRYATLAVTKPVLRMLRQLKRGSGTGYVFLSNGGYHISLQQMRAMMFAYAIISGWPDKKQTPYIWRHAFVTGHLETTKDYHMVRRLARHRTFAITTTYTHLKNLHLRESAAKVEEALGLTDMDWGDPV